jgi:hypothetical protein
LRLDDALLDRGSTRLEERGQVLRHQVPQTYGENDEIRPFPNGAWLGLGCAAAFLSHANCRGKKQERQEALHCAAPRERILVAI